MTYNFPFFPYLVFLFHQKMNGGAVNEEAEKRIRLLEAQNLELTQQLNAERNERMRLQRIVEGLNPNAVANLSQSSAEQRIVQAERELEIERLNNQATEMELRELVFRERVLLAMCTISEGDYLRLCDEAGVDPRDVETNSSLVNTQPTKIDRLGKSSGRSKRHDYDDYEEDRYERGGGRLSHDERERDRDIERGRERGREKDRDGKRYASPNQRSR